MSIKNGTDIIMTKSQRALIAEDVHAAEVLEKISNGQYVKVKITVPRNIKHHRKFFALLNITYEAQPEPRFFPTVDSLLDAIKMATGHVRYFKDLHGREHAVPDSIGFGRMDQIKFAQFYEAAIAVILERVLPNIPRVDLEQRIYEILGEIGPDAIR